MKKRIKLKMIVFTMVILGIIFLININIYALDNSENSALAGGSFEDGFVISVNSDGQNTCTIEKYDSEIVTNIVPETIKGYTVTRIASKAYKDSTKLYGRVTIPNSVIYIGEEAFSGCSKVTAVTIGKGLTEIEDKVFYGCNLINTVTINGNITSIGDEAFSGCNNLKKINLSNTITEIGTNAFRGCLNLESISLPSSLETIGDYAFYNCYTLSNIAKILKIPSNVKKIGQDAFFGTSYDELDFSSKVAPTITSTSLRKSNSPLKYFKIRLPSNASGYTKENNWPVDNFVERIKGDLDGNGIVNSTDASIALDLYRDNNATAEDIEYGDLDNNKIINSTDASLILDIYRNGN